MNSQNKALVLSGPGILNIEKRDVPSIGVNEVLVRIDSASICHTDFVVIDGEYSRIKYPTVPGHEFSGVIEKSSKNVRKFKRGDRVVVLGYFYCGECTQCKKGRYTACENIKGIPMDTDGAYQQMISVSADFVYKIGDSLAMEEASLTEPAANGYAAAKRGNIEQGETVVVIGPGPIGLIALQAAKLYEPKYLIMLGTRKERLDLATEFGATHTVNVRERDEYKAIMDITDGQGADVVLFCGGGEDAWDISSKILKKFGRIVIEALPSPYDARWKVPVADFTEKSISYLGVSGYTPKEFEEVLKHIEKGAIKVKPLITHTFSIDNFEEAFETVLQRKDGAIKVVIKPNE